MNPIPVHGHEGGPGDYILPVKWQYLAAADKPVLVQWWQWLPAASGSQVGGWKLVTATG